MVNGKSRSELTLLATLSRTHLSLNHIQNMLPFIEVFIGSFLLLDSSTADALLKGDSLELEIIKHYSCHLAIVKYEL